MKSFVVLGPSDKTKLTRFTSVDNYDNWLSQLVEQCTKSFDELYFIPDKGVYVDFARRFLKKKGASSVIAVIPHGEEWLVKRAQKIGANRVYEMKYGYGWNYLNTHFIGLADYALYLGYSSGSMLELVSAKYIRMYENHSTTVFIDGRAVSQKLPFELEEDLKHFHYFNNIREFEELLNKYVR